jgi:hypothetical protein
MNLVTVDFGEWLPDLPAFRNPGAIEARNCIPEIKSYRQLNALSSFSDALTGACLGAFWAQDAANVVYNFAGDQTKLYELQDSITWADVSGSSAPYSAANWEFTKFGQRVIAAAKAEPLQKFDLGTDTVFDDLAGSPPQAARIATVRDFVMLGDVASLGPNYLQWSGFNNTELWTPSIATQSDFQELQGRGGKIQQIVPGNYGIVFCEQSIFRADYVGPPLIFRIDEIERKRGTPAPRSVVWSGGQVWYYGWDGFYHFDGVKSTPISANKVARWFAQNADSTVFDSMNGVVDRLNRLVMWAFKSSSSATYNDRVLIYNWAADKWAYAEIDTQLLTEYVAPGLTLDELDTPLSSGIDIDSISVDSDQFTGGSVNIMAFDSSNKSATFDGTPLTAVIDTKELAAPDDDHRVILNGVRPQIEANGASTITVAVGTRNRLGDTPSFGVAHTLNGINGEASFRVNSRYQRYRISISGGFDNAIGARARVSMTGGRR